MKRPCTAKSDIPDNTAKKHPGGTTRAINPATAESRALTPFDAVYTPAANQEHVAITAGVYLAVLEQNGAMVAKRLTLVR